MKLPPSVLQRDSDVRKNHRNLNNIKRDNSKKIIFHFLHKFFPSFHYFCFTIYKKDETAKTSILWSPAVGINGLR